MRNSLIDAGQWPTIKKYNWQCGKIYWLSIFTVMNYKKLIFNISYRAFNIHNWNKWITQKVRIKRSTWYFDSSLLFHMNGFHDSVLIVQSRYSSSVSALEGRSAGGRRAAGDCWAGGVYRRSVRVTTLHQCSFVRPKLWDFSSIWKLLNFYSDLWWYLDIGSSEGGVI